METNQEKIKIIVDRLIDRSMIELKKKVDTAINSGSLDIDNWDELNSPMIIPKIILIALLENEAEQYKGYNTSFEKEIKKEVKNLKYFL
jgi:hypothetical protein